MPTRIVSGQGSLGRIGEIARELGMTDVLVVSDPVISEQPYPGMPDLALPIEDVIAEGEKVLVRLRVKGTHGGEPMGNLNGVEGRAACGTLGYPKVDVAHARRTVAVTDTLVPFPATPIEIGQENVDHVVVVPSIGERSGIVSGTTRPTEDPAGLLIAGMAARVVAASGLLVEGFSFQTGAGGVSLAAAAAVRAIMRERGVVGSFASGGITGQHVAMLEEGLFRSLLDVQCFDSEAVRSFRHNPDHLGMSASMYASPSTRGAVVDRLEAVILGATEVDLDFNVDVATGSDGRIVGGSGGHADTAAGAALAIVTTRLRAGGSPKIVDRVRALTTPGRTIDAVVTEAGVAVNPARADLLARLEDAGVPLASIADLHARSGSHAPRPHTPSPTRRATSSRGSSTATARSSTTSGGSERPGSPTDPSRPRRHRPTGTARPSGTVACARDCVVRGAVEHISP